MDGFHRALDELWERADAALGARRRLRRGRAHARVGRAPGRRPDRGHRPGRPEAARPSGPPARRPNLEYRAEEATRLSFADDEFDLAAAIEVLEHVPEPEATVAEMARVAERWLLVSVPREPLWRGLNMARGAYWGPGQHARPREPLVQALVRRMLLARTGRSRRRARRSPGRCCSSGSRRPGRSGRGTRGPLGRDRDDRARHLRATSRSPATPDRVRLRRHHAAVVGGVHHRVGALPAGRAAAVAHDRRPRRARQTGPSTCAWRRRSSWRSAVLFAVAGAGVPGADPGRPLRRLATLYWVLIVAVLAYAASLLRARLPGRASAASACTGGWC